MNQEDLNEIIYLIKRYQNGVISSDMQQKTGSTALNFGLTQPIMRDIALPYRYNNQLAILLWEKNIRECKIIATLIANPNDFEVKYWIDDRIDFEICEQVAFNQLSNKAYSLKALKELIDSNNEYCQCVGISGVSIMIIKNKIPIDQYIFLKNIIHEYKPQSEFMKIKVLNCLENLNHK